MMKIAICDDERDFLNQMEQYIHRYRTETGITVELSLFKDGDSFLSVSKKQDFHACFLDIVMPFINGMEIARELRKNNTPMKLIFVTSSAEFAVESYEVKADNYLLKPLSYEKFKAVLDDIHTGLSTEAKSLIIKTGIGYQRLFLKEIEYLEAMNKNVIITLRNGSTIETREPLYHFEEKLLDDDFFKCHRSYLVNIHQMATFNSSSIEMNSGKRIPIARGYAESLKNTYFRIMFGK